MPVIGAPRTFHDRFKFLVEIDGYQSAGFQKAGPIEIEAAVIEYNEGGTLIANKSPGRITVPNITLERGASFDEDSYDWFSQVVDASAVASLTPGAGRGAGEIEPLFKRDVDLIQLDRNGDVLRTWRLFGAWPTKFTAGEWDNEADEKVIEMIELAYDFPVLV